MYKTITCLLPLVCMSSMCYADDEGAQQAYVGIKAGRSHVDYDLSVGSIREVEQALGKQISIQHGDTIVDVVAGYRFNAYVGAEVSYLDLGRYDAKIDADNQATAKVAGATLSALWSYPFSEKFDVFARTGVMVAKSKTSAHYRNSHQEAFSAHQSRTDVVPVWGLGLRYAVTPDWQVTAEYRDVGSARLAKAAGESLKMEVDAFSVGVNYFF